MVRNPRRAVRRGTSTTREVAVRGSPFVPFRGSLRPLSSEPCPAAIAGASGQRQTLAQEEIHVALPQLRGQPAYVRPPRPVAVVRPRPLDPDDYPLEAFMTEDERAVAIAAREYGADGNGHGAQVGNSGGKALRPRPFRLRSLAGRFLGGE